MPSSIPARLAVALGAVSLALLSVGTGCGGVTEPAPQVSVSIAPSSVELLLGESRPLVATVTGSETAGVLWSSTAPTVASVTQGGTVSAVSPGTATIVATSVADASRSATANVSVRIPVSVTLDRTSATLEVGVTQQLVAVVSGATNTAVTWQSDASAVATVDQNGLVRAVSVGTANVTATSVADAGKKASALVTVFATPIVVSPASVSLEVGATRQLSASGTGSASALWSSSAPGVASVDQTGRVTALARGSATIRATVGDRSGAAEVTVTDHAPTGYRVLVSTPVIATGATTTVTAYVVDASGAVVSEAGRVVTWSTGQPGGSFSPASSTTAADGSATTTFTAGGAAGTWSVTATDQAGLTGSATVRTFAPGAPSATALGIALSYAEPNIFITFSGSVTPNGLSTQAWFEWSRTASFATFTATPKQSVGAGSDPVAITQKTCDFCGGVQRPPGGDTLFVRVAAENSSGLVRSATIKAPPPATPSNFQSAYVDPHRVALTWTHDGVGADQIGGFRVRRRDLADPSGSWVRLLSEADRFSGYVPWYVRTVTDDSHDVAQDHTWQYELSACNYFGCSATVVLQQSTPRVPPATSLRVQGVAGGSVTLAWNDNSSTETGFLLQRRVSGSPDWVNVLQVEANVSTADVAPPPAGVAHTYRVRPVVSGNANPTEPRTASFREDRYGAPSNEVIVLP